MNLLCSVFFLFYVVQCMDQQALIQTLSNQTGINISFNAAKKCRLRFDNKFIVDFEISDDDKGLWLFSDLGALSSHPDSQSLLIELMQAHLFMQDTNHTLFGLDADQNIIAFSYLDLSSITAESLSTSIEEFLDVIAYWSNKLNS